MSYQIDYQAARWDLEQRFKRLMREGSTPVRRLDVYTTELLWLLEHVVSACDLDRLSSDHRETLQRWRKTATLTPDEARRIDDAYTKHRYHERMEDHGKA